MKFETVLDIGCTGEESGYPYHQVLVTAHTTLVGADIKIGFALIQFWVSKEFGYKEFDGNEISELLTGERVWSSDSWHRLIATKYEGAKAVEKLQEIKRNLIEKSEAMAKAKVEEIRKAISD